MLKIKDDVDLKELEKFGFKPKYDIDTGKIFKYICEGNVGWTEPKTVTLITIIQDMYQRGQYDNVEYWHVIIDEKCNMSIELLYDLIKANLIEKD